jgi:MFS transporter, ACS family, D-galactonate transporter
MPAHASRTAARTRWLTVALFGVGMIIAQFHRIDLSVAMPAMASDFGWSRTAQGLALSSFYWTYSLFLIPAGLALDRFGVRVPLTVAFLVWSAASAATSLASTVGLLVLCRLLVGAGEAFVAPAAMRYIRAGFEEERRGVAVSLFIAGTKVGPAIAFPLATVLMASFGWRAMFLLVAVTTLPWAALYLWRVPRGTAAQRPAPEEGPVPAGDARRSESWGVLLRQRYLWGICLGAFSYMYFLGFCLTWMPAYLHEQYGMDLARSGWFTGFSFGGIAAVTALAGWAADVLIRRGRNPVAVRRGFTIAGLLAASLQAASTLTGAESVMLFATVVSLSGLGLATANYWALTQSLVPANRSAVAAGIQNAAGHLATVVSPWLTGWLVEHSGRFHAPVQVAGLVLLLGVFAYGVLVRK